MRKCLMLSLALGAAALDCPDPNPGGGNSCEQQKEWGKCDTKANPWMIGNCCKTCFNCTAGCGATPTPAPPQPPVPQCPDPDPGGGNSCEQQKEWGKCDTKKNPWMIGNCCKTCFNCTAGCGATPSPAPSPTPPSPGPQCPDPSPGGSDTCAQQKAWGQCTQDWMVGKCCKTCFNCTDGCGKHIPARPACANQSVEPEGKPGKQAAPLFEQLKTLWKSQTTTLSGQTNEGYDDLTKLVKKSPAVKAFDMQNYSPHNPWHPDWSSWDDGSVANAIAWHKSTNGKGIVSFQWHWFSPMGGNLSTSTFMAKNTNFNTAQAVVSGSPENIALIHDLGAIAKQLTRLRDAGVPVLWRPLHEARGNDAGAWFWWGTAGPKVLLKILDIMRDVFLNHYLLDNLVWVWSEPNADWYPGNDKIDILGVDSYPAAYDYGCDEGTWNQYLTMTNCKKMLTLAEVGAIPNFDNCYKQGIRWLYFLAWGNLFNKSNTEEHLHQVFDGSHVKSIEDLMTTTELVV